MRLEITWTFLSLGNTAEIHPYNPNNFQRASEHIRLLFCFSAPVVDETLKEVPTVNS